MWRKRRVVSAAVVVALVAGCTESSTTTARPLAASRADLESTHGARVSVRDYSPEIPIAYYNLSLQFTKQTAGFTPPVQARAFGYMGLALYEALVGGMPDHRSVAGQLNGIGPLPEPTGAPYQWPLVANAALAEVMRGLWGDKTNRAADNIAALDALEASFASQYGADVPPGLAMLSINFGHAVGAAVFATSQDDGGNQSYLTNFPTSYIPPQGPGLWVPTAPGQLAQQPFWGTTVKTLALSGPAVCDPGPPPTYSEQPGSAFYSEAALDSDLSSTLTPEQTTMPSTGPTVRGRSAVRVTRWRWSGKSCPSAGRPLPTPRRHTRARALRTPTRSLPSGG